MMLPSGNDAAYALGEGIGYLIYFKFNLGSDPKLLRINNSTNNNTNANNYNNNESNCNLLILDSFRYERSSEFFVGFFLKEMNKKAIHFGLEKTHFASVHGLMNKMNISTAKDIALLSSYAMENSTFRALVSTLNYSCKNYLP